VIKFHQFSPVQVKAINTIKPDSFNLQEVECVSLPSHFFRFFSDKENPELLQFAGGLSGQWMKQKLRWFMLKIDYI
jgi:hypothetical protein